jgi:glycosyltransferase involved in cell wall biosynthesis
VQDAGSQDETIEVLRTWGDRVVWRSEPDSGQSDGLNRAYRSARGRWIAWLNADEFYFPRGLRTLIAAGEKAGADVVFGDAVFVDADGKLLRMVPQHRYSPFVLRHYGPYISSCAAVFRRSILGRSPWDAEVHRVMDWELYLRLGSQGARFVHIPYPVAAFRVHEAQITAMPAEAEDSRAVKMRYGISGRFLERPARLLHAAYKLLTGGYQKQLAARSRRGIDLRWIRPEVGPEGFFDLLRSCYGHR